MSALDGIRDTLSVLALRRPHPGPGVQEDHQPADHGLGPLNPTEPLLLVAGNSDGTGDGVMVARDEDALAYEYCQQGMPVDSRSSKGSTTTTPAPPPWPRPRRTWPPASPVCRHRPTTRCYRWATPWLPSSRSFPGQSSAA